jgi:hypothetical protein
MKTAPAENAGRGGFPLGFATDTKKRGPRELALISSRAPRHNRRCR